MGVNEYPRSLVRIGWWDNHGKGKARLHLALLVLLSLLVLGCSNDMTQQMSDLQGERGETAQYEGNAFWAIFLNEQVAVDDISVAQSKERIVSRDTVKETGLAECIDNLEQAVGDARLKAVRTLWYGAADLGVTEESMIALQLAALDPEPIVAQEAARALVDLQRLRTRYVESINTDMVKHSEGAQDLVQNDSQPLQNEHSRGMPSTDHPVIAAVVAKAINQYRDAVDANARAEAVSELARFDHADAVVMLQTAAIDADSVVRYMAVEALWRMAADGLDSGDRIQELLLQAAFDSEQQVSALATRALSDLHKLRNHN